MWKSQYPFESRWFKTPFAQRMHYIDVGSGFPVVMLHGNPTWSFMYRSLLAAAAQHGLRGIAPDHIGCGLSDKPQDWEYTLERHMTNLDALINDQLRLSHFDLVVHDWGGPIGLLYAVKHPEQIRKIVLMNTLGWVTNRFPRSIHLTRIPIIGALLVRSWNLLMRKALRSCTVKSLSKEARAGYKYPYKTYEDRIAIQRFPQDIPLKEKHPSYKTFKFLNENLYKLKGNPIFIAWGKNDFCLPTDFLDGWKARFPSANIKIYEEAAHLIFEDNQEEAVEDILNFLKQ